MGGRNARSCRLPIRFDRQGRARLFAFDASARLLASAPVLLGASRADGPAAPAATPAGRFVAATWLSVQGHRLVWINGDAAVFLHGIPSGVSPGRGSQRLASDDVGDKRISDGSLHVAQFYATNRPVEPRQRCLCAARSAARTRVSFPRAWHEVGFVQPLPIQNTAKGRQTDDSPANSRRPARPNTYAKRSQLGRRARAIPPTGTEEAEPAFGGEAREGDPASGGRT